jgi:hypothetical protein
MTGGNAGHVREAVYYAGCLSILSTKKGHQAVVHDERALYTTFRLNSQNLKLYEATNPVHRIGTAHHISSLIRNIHDIGRTEHPGYRPRSLREEGFQTLPNTSSNTFPDIL